MGQQNRQEHESLSALMDNAADDLELRRILKSCDRNPELLQTWERYHLAQAVLHDNRVAPVSATLASRIAEQVAAEAELSTTNTSLFRRWQQPLSRIAIAASVAVVFIVAVQSNTAPDSTPSLAQQAPASAEPTLLATEDAPGELDPAALQFLHDYIAGMKFDEREPVRTEHIQDSPLYKLVNQFSTTPPQ